jgi:hypothetical protein
MAADLERPPRRKLRRRFILGIALLLLAAGVLIFAVESAQLANAQCGQSGSGPPHPCPIETGLWGWAVFFPLVGVGSYLALAAIVDLVAGDLKERGAREIANAGSRGGQP